MWRELVLPGRGDFMNRHFTEKCVWVVGVHVINDRTNSRWQSRVTAELMLVVVRHSQPGFRELHRAAQIWRNYLCLQLRTVPSENTSNLHQETKRICPGCVVQDSVADHPASCLSLHPRLAQKQDESP